MSNHPANFAKLSAKTFNVKMVCFQTVSAKGIWASHLLMCAGVALVTILKGQISSLDVN